MNGTELEATREALGMSVTELAQWLGLEGENGRTAIREMERGKRSISGPIRRAIRLEMDRKTAGVTALNVVAHRARALVEAMKHDHDRPEVSKAWDDLRKALIYVPKAWE